MATKNTEPANKPIDVVKDGKMKATIWKNEGENGARYSVQLSRIWKDEAGEFHNSDSFSGTELLRVARLANIAYNRVVDLRTNDNDHTPV